MILEQITEQLTETLTSRVLTLFGHAIDRVVLQAPPRLAMGDLATPLCLELAKALKRKPRELAETMVNGLQLPMFVQSCHGMPMSHATGANTQPKICSRLVGNHHA